MDRGSRGTHQCTSAKPGYPPYPRVSEGQVATAYHSEPWSSSERASCVRRSQPGCLRLHGGVGAEPRLGKRLGLARGAGLRLDGQRRSKAPLCSSGSRSVRGSWRPAWGEREGNSSGYCGAKARHSKLHRRQDASLWRGCFSTVIPMSRAAFSVVTLRVEKCEQRRAQELPYQASPFVHLCQDPHVSFQMAQHKHRLLAPRSPSCSPAGAVWCRKLQVASSHTKMVGRNALNPAASRRLC